MPSDSETLPSAPPERPFPSRAAWGNVVLASLLMLATLPGRTQGLGLITEPMLKELKLEAVAYADINFWATLIGSAACLPAGWLMDRVGLRKTATVILILLAITVGLMSKTAGGFAAVFAFVFITRALGQSALSVAAITAVGKSFGRRSEMAMGVFSVLLSVFFAIAFVLIGGVVTQQGWRTAWGMVAAGLIPVAILTAVFFREPGKDQHLEKTAAESAGATPRQALRSPLFWVFAGATALFGLVSAGIGLFNEAVLAERGFSAETFHKFLAVTTLFSLVGQMLCGWMSMRRPMTELLAAAMFLYGAGLAALPLLQTLTHLWIFAAVFGVAAGFIVVIFFAIWSRAFGGAHLGWIQGAAQMLTVFASALGPVLFARSHAISGSHAPLLYSVAPVFFLFGVAAWLTKLPTVEAKPAA